VAALVAMPLAGDSQVIELNNPDGVRVVALDGVAEGDRAGYSVSGAGDFNGDGLADVLVGAYNAQRDGIFQGQAYVIFGTREAMPARLDLGSLDGANGFVLRGTQGKDSTGVALAGIGDFNGDGFDDIAIGSPSAATVEPQAGCVTVVFGRPGTWEAGTSLGVFTAALGVVFESVVRGEAGRGLSGAGDINGDGFADLVIGAPMTRNQYGASAGRVYVVFGGADWRGRVSLDTLARDGRGFVLEGRRSGDRAGWSVGGGGDFTGNGFPEVLVGAPRMMNPKPLDTGEAYVVFGGRGPFQFDLSLFYLNGDNGSRVTGFLENQWLGTSVGAVGDLNDDGVSELLFGASKSWPGGKPGGTDEGGQVFLVKGAAGPQRVVVKLAEPDILRLIHFDGPTAGDFLGWSVAGVGDADGDGLPDWLMSAHSADPSESNSGRTTLWRGKPTALLSRQKARVLSTADGWHFNGAGRWQISGVKLSGAGDFNGDGVADVIIGAPGGSPTEGDQIGRAFLVFGERLSTPRELIWTVWHPSGAAPLLGVGGPTDGRVSPPDARCWVGFDAGKGEGHQEASRTRVTRRLPEESAGASDVRVSWTITAERTEWSRATVRLQWIDAEVEGLSELEVVWRADDSQEWTRVADQLVEKDRRRATVQVNELGEFGLRGVAAAEGE
jgi:hypothetical protein